MRVLCVLRVSGHGLDPGDPGGRAARLPGGQRGVVEKMIFYQKHDAENDGSRRSESEAENSEERHRSRSPLVRDRDNGGQGRGGSEQDRDKGGGKGRGGKEIGTWGGAPRGHGAVPKSPAPPSESDSIRKRLRHLAAGGSEYGYTWENGVLVRKPERPSDAR